MIRVQVTAPFVEETREFKNSGRGIPTYLRRLKKLQKAHIEAATSKELGQFPHRYKGRNERRKWNRRRDAISSLFPLKISIRHV